MNLHHTAALALVGWYLIAPKAHYFKQGSRDADGKPIQGWMIDAGDDFSAWSIVGTCDTAARCEAERQTVLKNGLTFRDKRIDDPKGFAWVSAEASKRAQYIATDYPRLAK
jgi:hypothetical protein